MKITQKLKLNALLVLTFLSLNIVAAIFLTQRINSDVRQMSEVEEPLEQAILEMEINAGETARAVLDYIRDFEEGDLLIMQDSESDFGWYAQIFERLAETEKERELGMKVTGLYREFKTLGEEIVSLANLQSADLELFRKDVEAIEEIIDGKLQPSIDQSFGDALI